MPNFLTAHIPDFGENIDFPAAGDIWKDNESIDHITINYFHGIYSVNARKALRRVCAFVAPFESHTENVVLVGENNDIPATSIEIAPELLALHSLSIVAIEHACPEIKADRTWAVEKYNPHMTFRKENGVYIGAQATKPFLFNGITVWQNYKGSKGDYELVDKIRLKGEIHNEIIDKI